MWTTERQQEFRLCENDTAIQLHMHTDLLAIEGLATQLPLHMGARVITEKGYAVEALHGYLTRTHYDADVLIAHPYEDERPQTIAAITEVLERVTDRPWTTYEWEKANASSWVKFYEAGKRRWHEGITGTRRDAELANNIDVHLVHAPEPHANNDHIKFRARSGKVYQQSIAQATLRDALGKLFHLTVPTVNEQLSSKVHFSRSFEHRLRDSDFHDFALMFKHPQFDAALFLALLNSYFIGKGNDNHECAAIIGTELEWLSTYVRLPATLR